MDEHHTNRERMHKAHKEDEGKESSIGRHHSRVKSGRGNRENVFTKPLVMLIIAAALIMIINQFQIMSISSALSGGSSSGSRRVSFGGSAELSGIKINDLKSTAHTVAAVFPVEEFQSADDAMAAMFPTGTPEYGEALGVSFDDPVGSLARLAKMYRPLKAEVEKNNPEAFQRFVNLASNPTGVSCEYCCGVGPVGADKKGNSRCGCQHNPALLSVALWLTANTDYSDGEILREVMRWKTLFFPKNMIQLGASLSGGDTSVLENIPSMVGGC